jgi:anti-anti-sigma factor
LFDFQTACASPDLKSTIIDFSGVPYMDSAGLGIVLSHWAHTQRIGVKFAAVAMSEKVRVLLEMTGVANASAFLSDRRRRGTRIFGQRIRLQCIF